MKICLQQICGKKYIQATTTQQKNVTIIWKTTMPHSEKLSLYLKFLSYMGKVLNMSLIDD